MRRGLSQLRSCLYCNEGSIEFNGVSDTLQWRNCKSRRGYSNHVGTHSIIVRGVVLLVATLSSTFHLRYAIFALRWKGGRLCGKTVPLTSYDGILNEPP